MPNSLSHTVPPARILTIRDLEDPDRFIRVEDVPLLDAHSDEERGDVDGDLLRLLARNTNDRAARGEFAPVLLGHTVDGDDFPEVHQPPCVGYASGLRVGRYNGLPCLFGNLYIHKEQYSRLPTYPHRSVERMKGNSEDINWIDAVSLLRKAPERPLGKLSYSRSGLPDGAAMVRYARDLGPIAANTSLRKRTAARRDLTRRLQRLKQKSRLGGESAKTVQDEAAELPNLLESGTAFYRRFYRLLIRYRRRQVA